MCWPCLLANGNSTEALLSAVDPELGAPPHQVLDGSSTEALLSAVDPEDPSGPGRPALYPLF